MMNKKKLLINIKNQKQPNLMILQQIIQNKNLNIHYNKRKKELNNIKLIEI